MAGRIVLACYRPRPGGEEPLLDHVRRHVPRLRELGLATERPVQLLRAEDGTLLEIFEWVDDAAAERAHGLPAVREIWEAMGSVAEFVPPSGIAGLDRPFPHLDPIDGIVE